MNLRSASALSRRSFLAGAAAVTLTGRSAWPFSLPTRPLYAPRPSDVCFSSRTPRSNTIETALAFGANRLDWCYTSDRAFLSRARAAGLSVLGGALSPVLPDAVGGKTWDKGRVLDKAGSRVTAPWMRARQGVYWGCVNSPEYRQIWLIHARQGLDAGLDWFMQDDAQLNWSAARWGGCYCPYCRILAARESVDLDRDMLSFQMRSVARFHHEMQAEVSRMAGRPVPFAYNCLSTPGAPDRKWVDDLFAFKICEIDSKGFDQTDLARRLVAAELSGRPQAVTLRSTDVALNRRVAAWCYAHGGHMVAPWDVYLLSTTNSTNRFFGDPKDYTSIFPFARKLGPLLDKAAPPAPGDSVAWQVDRPGIAASLRADPAGSFAVLHLVSWDHDSPYTITLNPARAAGKRVTQARLLVSDGTVLPFEERGGRLVAGAPGHTWTVVEMRLG